ncbi:helix-turn-helix transcriptional regulator [Enterococcus cecorum]|uniref:helix-turn-helix domain-containing protein n=1 Tax=Enterococcus cecorum TaxID=44008 RepID=UPI0022D73E50|nr:helix-turn-helix transcriptional regulator [Enterococcus cecorum]CAI3378811.1 helix-turn-helix transcriptional regulator [Enterococcus cecorum]CAI3426780.1 helix-turn-helix transcriptional regulator [Enterococcus cecorum]CAI3434922.1 helix-turn-helix transcriptional regulator [Enterococcus cecorum]CAI3446350.1 helix-turn-helix transcriptional regulator [Enterococcus cecorum]
MLLDRVKMLAKNRGITIAELERKLDFSQGSISRWIKQSPSSERVQKVADYFDVSVDYLLGRSENMNNTDMDTKLERMMDNAMSYDGKPISDEDRPIIKGILKAYFDNKK